MIVETSATGSFPQRAQMARPAAPGRTRTSPARPGCAGCRRARQIPLPRAPRRPGRPAPHPVSRSPAPSARCRSAGVRGRASCGPATWRARVEHSTRPRRLPHLRRHGRPGPGLLPVQRRHHLRRRPHLGDGRPLPTAAPGRGHHHRKKSKVAETLAEFRGNFATTCSTRTCGASAPGSRPVVQWDDHEVRNNWYPGQVIADTDSRYTEKSVDVLAAHAGGRSVVASRSPPCAPERGGRVHRVLRQGPAPRRVRTGHADVPRRQLPGDQTVDPQGILGREQLEWLKRELSRSRAVLEGDRRRHADRPGRARRHRGEGEHRGVAQGDPARLWGVNCRSPSCCATSSTGGSPARCG